MTLVVQVLCARGLPGDASEKASPYVKLKYGSQQHSTKGASDLNFGERFEFRLLDPPGFLELEIFDPSLGADDFLARGSVELSRVLEKVKAVKPQPLRSFYPLTTKKGEAQGELELEFLLE